MLSTKKLSQLADWLIGSLPRRTSKADVCRKTSMLVTIRRQELMLRTIVEACMTGFRRTVRIIIDAAAMKVTVISEEKRENVLIVAAKEMSAKGNVTIQLVDQELVVLIGPV